jgi:hypothetical protein
LAAFAGGPERRGFALAVFVEGFALSSLRFFFGSFSRII